MLRNAVVGGVLAGVFAGAYAANWQSIYAGPDGTISVDRSSLSHEQSLVHAWLRMKLTKPDNPGDVTYDERSVHLTIDCDGRKYTMTSDTKWLRGKLMKKWEGDTDYFEIDPDRPLSRAAKVLCSKAYSSTQTRETVEG